MSSNFDFLRAEWPDVFEGSSRAEAYARGDARTACFHARRALELSVRWMYRSDPALKLPYQDHLSALIHEPTFRDSVGPTAFAKALLIKDLGNQAVHGHKQVRESDALTAVRELFHFAFWLVHTYARGAKAPAGLRPIRDPYSALSVRRSALAPSPLDVGRLP